jgi:hypothetical protein
MGWRRGGVGLCALVAVAGAALLAAPAQGVVQCGDVITKSKKLKANVVECPGTALTIDGDGIELDLNGHVIRTPGEDAIHVVAGSSDITIHGGVIRNAPDHGILVDETAKIKISKLAVRGGLNRGIQVNDSSDLRISNVGIADQGEAGLYLSGIDGAKVGPVGVEDVAGPGMDITGVDDLTLEHAGIIAGDSGTGVGLSISGVDSSTFYDLYIEGWGGDGVRYFPGMSGGDNSFTTVISRRNDDTGFYIGNGINTRFKNVVASRNETEGMFVDADAANVVVKKGRFNRNNDGLVFADGSTGSIGDNVANDNDEIGIIVPFPSTVEDLGGNRASGNGVVDCVNLACE